MTYEFIGPHGSLGFELRAVADLECAGAASWKEVCNLLPGQILLLFKVNKQLVIIWRELELRPTRSWCWWRHAFLTNNAGWTMIALLRWRIIIPKSPHLAGRRLVWQPMMVVLRDLRWR